ncbi:hypothetical protein LCGC14_1974840 [marine sediment metagenome]|uniref:Uncharacterized protein n=1 Tax=marine sediment metagenome TaxID=412755 RepID=A0A0F9FAM6_9ZZZZ
MEGKMKDKLMFVGRRGMTVCLIMAAVFTAMKFMGALGDPAYTDLIKWDLLGFFGAKGMEYLPQMTGRKR